MIDLNEQYIILIVLKLIFKKRYDVYFYCI